ncbi:MAG: hypothetical protein ACI9LV_000493 [Candidatus Nanohaloarchaea archaeon]|jgi:hypothetical protein
MSRLMKAGIGIGVLGALGLIAGFSMLDGCSTATGTIGQVLSDEMQQRCSNGMLLRNVGGGTLVVGLGLLGYGYIDERFAGE